MDWQLLVLIGFIVGLALIAILLLGYGRRHDVARETDPRFWAGLAFVGAGVAMIATAGTAAVGLIAVGGVLMFVGAARGKRPGKR
jgi:hypothetical protein